MNQNLVGVPLQEGGPSPEKRLPNAISASGDFARRLEECAILLDIDGTLLDLAPTPREVWVPPGLARTLNGLLEKTTGALALVSGRSLPHPDLIFAPQQFPPARAHLAQ